MKRYAVYFDTNLTFNNPKSYIQNKFVEQKENEEDTLKAFEKKYKVVLEWKKINQQNHEWHGWVIKEEK